MTKAVRVTMGLPFCQYAGGTGRHWRLKKWWDELGEEAGTGQGPEWGEVRMQRARLLPRIQKKREVPASLRCGQACPSAGSGPILRLDVAARAQGICFWAFISFMAGFQPAARVMSNRKWQGPDEVRPGRAGLWDLRGRARVSCIYIHVQYQGRCWHEHIRSMNPWKRTAKAKPCHPERAHTGLGRQGRIR